MIIKQLNTHRQKDDFKAFYSKIESYLPEVREFISNSLKAAENEGKIDRGYYDSEGILDEVYLSSFSEFDPEWDEAMFRYYLLKKAVDQLDEKIIIESSTAATKNTGDLLKEELDRLREDFTTDGDGDLILNTELDDISYKQERRFRSDIYMDRAIEKLISERLNMDSAFQLSSQRRATFGYLFSTIPHMSKIIFELYVFANQSASEISLILDIDVAKINRILKMVTERLKRV